MHMCIRCIYRVLTFISRTIPFLLKEHTLSTFIWLNKLNYVKFIMFHNK